MADNLLSDPIVIRFDGSDASRHEIDLRQLSVALDGLSRIIAASSNLAITGELSTRRDTQKVRVVARTPRDGCYIIDAVVQYAHHHPMFRDYSIAVVSGLTVGIISFVFSKARGRSEEMKHLSEGLQLAIKELGAKDRPTIDRLLDTIDKMADELKPAARRAVAPIGESARTLSVSLGANGTGVKLDEADKAAIMSPAGLSVGEEKRYKVLISELDMFTGSCHVDVEGDEVVGRHPAKITDPECSLPNNIYVLSMAAQRPLAVWAKATIREGVIERLFISNHEGRLRGEPSFSLA